MTARVHSRLAKRSHLFHLWRWPESALRPMVALAKAIERKQAEQASRASGSRPIKFTMQLELGASESVKQLREQA